MFVRAGRHRGFTLVELLIVITIIGVLVSLGSYAGYRALIAVRTATLAFDVGALKTAVADFKGKNKDVFPECANDATVTHNNRMHAFFRNAFNRHTESVATINALIATLDQSEAIVYFLGGNPNPANNLLDNPQFPISGPGSPKKIFDFKAARLVDFDGDGYYSYVQPHGAGTPYVYFDNATYGLAYFPPAPAAVANAAVGYAVAYGTDNATPASAWEEPDTCQIVAAGLDGNYGDWGGAAPTLSLIKFFPSGAGGANPRTAYSKLDYDNVTTFAQGTLQSRMP